MKAILIDTNIILDIAFKRIPFYEKAGNILLYLEAHPDNIKAYLSASTITDIYYIVSRKTDKQKAFDFIKDILEVFDIAGVDRKVIDDALQSGLKDFEDAVQESCAQRNNISMIISRNKKDFKESLLDVFTPDEFLSKI